LWRNRLLNSNLNVSIQQFSNSANYFRTLTFSLILFFFNLHLQNCCWNYFNFFFLADSFLFNQLVVSRITWGKVVHTNLGKHFFIFLCTELMLICQTSIVSIYLYSQYYVFLLSNTIIFFNKIYRIIHTDKLLLRLLCVIGPAKKLSLCHKP